MRDKENVTIKCNTCNGRPEILGKQPDDSNKSAMTYFEERCDIKEYETHEINITIRDSKDRVTWNAFIDVKRTVLTKFIMSENYNYDEEDEALAKAAQAESS